MAGGLKVKLAQQVAAPPPHITRNVSDPEVDNDEPLVSPISPTTFLFHFQGCQQGSPSQAFIFLDCSKCLREACRRVDG